jgi:hypothetical protein
VPCVSGKSPFHRPFGPFSKASTVRELCSSVVYLVALSLSLYVHWMGRNQKGYPRPARVVRLDPCLCCALSFSPGHGFIYLSIHPSVSFLFLFRLLKQTNPSGTAYDAMTAARPEPHSQHNPRTGRKGDPRMHRAVAARLNDPNLSLFDALTAGGFTYPTDEDANYMDSEQVTLGQRKNQLSRRLRLARKQTTRHSPHHENDENSSSHSSTSHGGKRSRPSDENGHHGVSVRKRNVDPNDPASLQNDQQQIMLEELSVATAEAEEDRPRLMAKFHPQYHPILVPRIGNHHHPMCSSASNTNNPSTSSRHNPSATNTHLGNSDMPFATSNNRSTYEIHYPPERNNDPTAPSGVAIASLNSTALSLGITLEQLAMTLNSTSTLAKIINGDNNTARQKDLALHLYQNKNKVLYEKSMVLAGYPMSDAREGSAKHLEFAFDAWKIEGQRLQALAADRQAEDPPMEAKTGSPQPHSVAGISRLSQSSRTEFKNHSNIDPGRTAHKNSSTNGHQHRHANESECGLDGRHVHRLEGKCGHKAILHKMPDGSAHIDFVVGDKVECYHSVQPARSGNGGNRLSDMWPSKYLCEDLNCPKHCNNQALQHQQHGNDCQTLTASKILDLESIDLDGKEWSTDFTNDDTNSLRALLNLGDSDIGRSRTTSVDDGPTTNELLEI